LIPYGRQSVSQEDIDAVVDVLNSDFLTQGPKCEEFEKSLATCCEAKYAVAFSSGTSALHAAYFSAGLKCGDEFITSPITFASTANAGCFLGATPVFCDVQPETGNLDPQKLEALITEKTRLIIPVHYGGNPCQMEEISRIAKKHKIPVVEDACHALGGEYQNQPMGSCQYSAMSVFSFHPVKSIATGEGGAVTTNDEQTAALLHKFRSHGITKNPAEFLHPSHGPWYSEMHFLGNNYRLSEIHAALGVSQLRKLKFFITEHQRIAKIYQQELTNVDGFTLSAETSVTKSAWHLFPILLNSQLRSQKKEIFLRLHQQNVGVQCHYLPVYQHPWYQQNFPQNRPCPEAEIFYQSVFTLPVFPTLTSDDQQNIIKILKKTVAEHLL
jgi:UDP-4-amino-4,6-dideoxy-N-acetyl-beta-L-altrosamine transaminase